MIDMEEKDIRTYAQLMQELGLSGLEVEENGLKLRLERPAQAEAAAPAAVVPVPAPAAVPEKPAEVPARAGEGLAEICSPMVGLFYSAPAENAEPFVRVGSRVHKGDVLCIIEAMKLMNEIEADQDGVIAEVCVGNNQIVDYGHVLFRLRKE